MWINYPEKITESADELWALEKKRSAERSVADRLKMLRLLKSGQCRSRRQVAGVLGYSERQLGRWFETYREKGLQALCHTRKPGGKDERVTPEAWEALCKQMKAGEVARRTPVTESCWSWTEPEATRTKASSGRHRFVRFGCHRAARS